MTNTSGSASQLIKIDAVFQECNRAARAASLGLDHVARCKIGCVLIQPALGGSVDKIAQDGAS